MSAKKWRLGKKGYICENAETILKNVTPNISCKVVDQALPPPSTTRKLDRMVKLIFQQMLLADFDISSKYPMPDSDEFDELSTVMSELQTA